MRVPREVNLLDNDPNPWPQDPRPKPADKWAVQR
jgi:hypothetical protein